MRLNTVSNMKTREIKQKNFSSLFSVIMQYLKKEQILCFIFVLLENWSGLPMQWLDPILFEFETPGVVKIVKAEVSESVRKYNSQ